MFYGVADCISFDDTPNGPANPGAHRASDPRPHRVADPGPDNRPDGGADAKPDVGPYHLRADTGTNLRLPTQLW